MSVKHLHEPLLGAVALASLLSCARFGYELLGGSSSGTLDASSSGSGGTLRDAAADSRPSGGAGGAGGQAGETGADASLSNPDSGTVPALEAGPPPVSPAVCAFGAPEVLGDPNFAGNEVWSPTLSANALTMYLGVVVPGISEQIMVSVRPDRGNTFGLGNVLSPPLTVSREGTPHLLGDGLSLYFYSDRAGGQGDRDLYVATRDAVSNDFDTVNPLAELNSSSVDHAPWVSDDELTIYFTSNRDTGELNIWRSTRSNRLQPFGAPSLVTEINSGSDEGAVTLSPDQRVVIFASRRPGGVGDWDLYRASRATTVEPFSALALVPNVNTGSLDLDPALTADGQELFFTSDSGTGVQIWRSQRTCL